MKLEQLSAWVEAESIPAFAVNEVQVWRLATDIGEANLAAAGELLQPYELNRAQRMRAGTPRDEFVLGRACLRALLSQALQRPAGEIQFEAGPFGKPRIAGVASGIDFNVAHSHGLILIAMCRGAAVGVDIERVDARIEAQAIAEKNFAPAERAVVERASESERNAEFCRIWVKKEAVVKAHGQGITVGLTTFDVSGPADDAICLPRGKRTEAYFVKELPVEEGFAAALATEGTALPVTLFKLSNLALNDLLQVF